MSDAPFVQAYQLPATIDPQIVAGMARAYELRVIKQTPASIIVEGLDVVVLIEAQGGRPR